MSRKSQVFAPVSNYYGAPYVRRLKNGSYVFGLENWDGEHEVSVTKEFYSHFIKQFGQTS